MGDLKENSISYYDGNVAYKIFSDAEDFPGFISDYLSKNVWAETILDAGCGTGKFTKIIEKISNKYIGIDKSEAQIKLAKKNNESNYLIADLENIPLDDNEVDVTISAWCLGTIDVDKRERVLSELMRVTKDKIILIENLEGSEFEVIRGHDKDLSTFNYLNYLKEHGFILEKEIDTYFKFDETCIAKNIFNTIYEEDASKQITSKRVKHKVGIFSLEV